jgi:hypothetical protein
MNAAERDEVLAEAFTPATASIRVHLVAISAKVRQYEARYEMSSADLPAALASNRIRETAEICDWLFWSDVRDRLEQARA